MEWKMLNVDSIHKTGVIVLVLGVVEVGVRTRNVHMKYGVTRFRSDPLWSGGKIIE